MDSARPSPTGPKVILGPYALFRPFAAGGMATVHLGRLAEGGDGTRAVAIKRMHPHVAEDPDFATMFLNEARLALRIHHANVVATLDVVTAGSDLAIVMEYIHGESLAFLLPRF